MVDGADLYGGVRFVIGGDLSSDEGLGLVDRRDADPFPDFADKDASLFVS